MRRMTAQLSVGTGDDVALVHRAKQGDIAAFEGLVRRHTDMIRRVAMRMTDSREDAEDIAQEAFLKAFQHLPHFQERSRFSTWLTRIAINEALIRLRRPHRKRTISMDSEAGEFSSLGYDFADGKPGPEQICQITQLRGALRKALTSLPHEYRIVLLKRDVEGLSTLETAEMLELSVPSVKARLLRARLKLRAGLTPYIERGGESRAA